ncbi:hypothetical protein JTB14_036617 [Gonioctena quinquepunctata]|nr:hypothetical protein JTB14_036617 [Gonioctena quinquepunctata]
MRNLHADKNTSGSQRCLARTASCYKRVTAVPNGATRTWRVTAHIGVMLTECVNQDNLRFCEKERWIRL